jgi:hypothetical protein
MEWLSMQLEVARSFSTMDCGWSPEGVPGRREKTFSLLDILFGKDGVTGT